MGKKTHHRKVVQLLKLNGWDADNSEAEFECFVNEDNSLPQIDVSESEVVFIGESGDYLHIECNYYTVLGALIDQSIVGIGFKRPLN